MSKNVTQIYSDIRSCHFLNTNIFGYLFVSKSIRMSHSGTEVFLDSVDLIPKSMRQIKGGNVDKKLWSPNNISTT